MSRLKLHTLDDLDREDIVESFNKAYAQLESVLYKVEGNPDVSRQVDTLLAEIDALATQFEEAEYAADVYARD